jgi:hypothetical protein
MIDYIIDLVKIKRLTATQAPIALTLQSMEETKKYHTSLMSRTLLQVHIIIPWKASASLMLIGNKVQLYCFKCKFNSNKQVNCHLLHKHHNWSKNKTLFPIWTIFGVSTWCVLANGVYWLSTSAPSAKQSMRQIMRTLCGFLMQTCPIYTPSFQTMQMAPSSSTKT